MEGQPRALRIFAELEDRLARLEPKGVLNLRRDVWVISITLTGMLMTLPLPSYFGMTGGWIGWVALAGLTLELCGFGVFFYRQMREIVPDFINAKRKFAAGLDSGLVEHEEVVAWLRSLTLQERDRCMAYVDHRLEVLAQRYQVMFGAVDKLGLLPLLAAVFVQIQAMERVSVFTTLFAVLIISLYVMAIWVTGFRLQMQGFARLLEVAGARRKNEIPSTDPEAV